MSAQEFEIEVNGHLAYVYRENSIAPDDPYRFYLPHNSSSGQSCWTVWFRSLVAAKRALSKDGVKIGADFADCNQCACRHPQGGFKPHICHQAKQEYAATFDVK